MQDLRMHFRLGNKDRVQRSSTEKKKKKIHHPLLYFSFLALRAKRQIFFK